MDSKEHKSDDSKAECKSVSEEAFSTSEKICRKRKHFQQSTNNIGETITPEMPILRDENSVSTLNTGFHPVIDEQTFPNYYSNNLSDANQYGMIPPYSLYPLAQWSDPNNPPKMFPTFHNTNPNISESTYSGPLVNNVQPFIAPENPPFYGIPSGMESYNYASNIKQIINLPSCVLYPPPPNAVINRRAKPPGCRTVFIGGVPGKITEDIIREAFSLYGKIVTIRMNTKNFCHVRFSCQEEVERAFSLSGYRMKIENKDEPPYSGRLHVDYAVAKDDQHEAECAERLALRRARHQALKEQEALEMNNPTIPPFSEVELQNLLAQFRNSSFKDGVHTLNTWLQKGEVQKRNAGTFFTIIQSLNHNIRRLQSEKEKFEEGNKKAKLLHRQKLHSISVQLSDIEKLFVLAQQPKNWDQFSKTERINIDLWKKQTSETKLANFEQLIDERIEDEMELSDADESVIEDNSKSEAKLLKEKIREVERDIASIEKNIMSVKKEKDATLERLSLSFDSVTEKLKNMHKEYETQKALHNAMMAVKVKENLSTGVSVKTSSHCVEVSPKDARLLSLICQFLIVHRFDVNVNYICSYLDKIVSNVSASYVTSLMRRFPGVFKESISGIGATLERKWSVTRPQISE